MKYKCTNGGYATIIEHNKGDIYCLVEFDNVISQRGYVGYSNLCNGRVKNPWQPTVRGVGYIGKIFDKDHPLSKNIAYKHWIKMIERCYNPMHRKYKFYGAKGVIVCEEWLCFANYETWFNQHYYEIPNCDMVVDKDVLDKTTKIYSPNTCVIIPSNINKLFCNASNIRGDLPIGVAYHKQNHNYIASISIDNKSHHLGCFNTITEAFMSYKVAKEKYIKEMADRYKEYLPQNVYDAIYRYQVEIID